MAISYGVFTPETAAELMAQSGAVESMVPTLYVNSVTGSNSYAGTSPSQPLATIAEAVGRAQNGAVIGIFGVFREHVVTPLGLQDVTIVGLANTPRQATTSGAPNGGGATWLSPSTPTNTSALIKVRGQGWTLRNIYFNNSATSNGCVEVFTDGDPPSASDGAHLLIDGCILTGADEGVHANGGTNFVYIKNSILFGFSGSGDLAIGTEVGAGVGTLLGWEIIGCKFFNNAGNITAGLSHARIQNCMFENGSASNIDLTGGTAPNVVVNNFFNIAAADFDPAGGTTGVTGDVWSNTLTDTIETGLPAN